MDLPLEPEVTILKTTDDGNNWEIIAGETEDDLYGVSFTDANIGTVVGNFGAILRTTDAGNHWTIQRDGMSDVLYGVSFTDANNGTAVGSDGLILRTTNGGTSNILNDVLLLTQITVRQLETIRLSDSSSAALGKISR
jgi:Uncharacterized protein related to plant photosystem II stability/assembly factor